MAVTYTPIEFEITQEDIYNGVKSDCENCPAALAINRKLRELNSEWEFCDIYPNEALFATRHNNRPYGKHSWQWVVPEELTEFVDNFDGHSKQPSTVQPMKFTLKVPDYESVSD